MVRCVRVYLPSFSLPPVSNIRRKGGGSAPGVVGRAGKPYVPFIYWRQPPLLPRILLCKTRQDLSQEALTSPRPLSFSSCLFKQAKQFSCAARYLHCICAFTTGPRFRCPNQTPGGFLFDFLQQARTNEKCSRTRMWRYEGKVSRTGSGRADHLACLGAACGNPAWVETRGFGAGWLQEASRQLRRLTKVEEVSGTRGTCICTVLRYSPLPCEVRGIWGMYLPRNGADTRKRRTGRWCFPIFLNPAIRLLDEISRDHVTWRPRLFLSSLRSCALSEQGILHNCSGWHRLCCARD
ncbi:hypothetical protein N658DRAFT_14128 [Parathielavia hyrcaniae]|uniref:Uncharacterized protein n=1 Tax=Parathielavia hyrcaniae TaxID=113614 RepID=A0AAN6Q9T0_9PEZI|nr:hypothetical protein N658DRAFT_14128 [Parathielavia hyrcaniae]